MNLKDLDKLKEILAGDKDLSAAYRYFMDHFGEDESFLSLGKPTPHPMLQSLIAASAGQILGIQVAVVSFFLIPVPGTTFIHGAGTVNGRPVNVLYFTDIQVGIIAVMQGPSGGINYSRFSARSLPPEGVPSKN